MTVGTRTLGTPIVLCTPVLHLAGMTPAPTGPPNERVGVRELRNQVASVMRRAAAGERLIVTVDGVPTAQLGPLDPPTTATLLLDDLVAAGLVEPPQRLGHHPLPPPAEDVPVDVRPDRVMDELRGGP